jgi:DNA polymerase I-like protein with 3'-5' exonuclease and polymerase domains
MMQKNYTIVKDQEGLSALLAHIEAHPFHAFDTETTGLNTRKDKVIGLSVSGVVGTAFYVPLLSWDKTFHCLKPVFVTEAQFIDILLKLQRKELLMWNGSFDVRMVKSNFNIDLTHSLLADIMLMKHTVEEEGEFGLKETAVELGQKIGLAFGEDPANEEQIALKANVLANGGTWVQDDKQMYKADLDVLGPYACADADITLRCAEYYKDILEQEGLEEFFYDKEVMPLYKYVTIMMEEKGVKLDLPKIQATRIAIVEDMSELERKILEQLNELPEVQEWKRKKASKLYPPKNTGSFAQAVCDRFSLPLPKTAAGKYSLAVKELQNLPESEAKHFLLNTDNGEEGCIEKPVHIAPKVLSEISWQLFVKSGQDKININSKQQMGQIVFEELGIKPLGFTDKGAPQFNEELIQH